MKTLMIILSLVPALIDAIKAIEAAIPGQGKGEQKLAAIREIMEVSYDNVSSIWPYVSQTVGILVSLFNNTDTFSDEGSPSK